MLQKGSGIKQNKEKESINQSITSIFSSQLPCRMSACISGFIHLPAHLPIPFFLPRTSIYFSVPLHILYLSIGHLYKVIYLIRS